MGAASITGTPRAEAAWKLAGERLDRELIVLGDDQRRALLARWEEIRRAEAQLDDRLTVGLVGGTGVGKSTLINALAGARISQSGDRRPTTDRVIAYRHDETPLPDGFPIDDIADPQKVHRSAELERVIVLDFPDFDSVEELHHEILERFFPLLDVLVVVVDDVKYGDARLFELLQRLPQSPENIHVVLNKVDSLQSRYPDRWREVAAEIVADLRAKLGVHARLELPAERFLALSALTAYRQRAGEAGEEPAEAGEFDGFVALVESYRLERRRRAAKELNIETRQEALLEDVVKAAPGAAAASRVERSCARLAERRDELARAASSLAGAVLEVDERRRISTEHVGRGAHHFGFPIDFLLTLRSRFGRGRARRGKAPELGAGRLQRHFRPYLDAVDNLLHDVRQDVGAIALQSEAPAASPPEDVFTPALRDLDRRLGNWEDDFRKRWRGWNHVPAALVALGAVLSIVHPPLQTAVRGWADGKGIPWGDAAREVVLSLVGILSPLFLLGTIVALALAYVVTAAVVWTRQLQRIERELREVEQLAGRLVSERGEARLDALAARLERWLRERRDLVSLRD